MLVFGKKCLYLGKWLYLGKLWLFLAGKIVRLVPNGCIWANGICTQVDNYNGSIWAAKWLYLGKMSKMVVFGQLKWFY